jgi:hypothetical protein
MCGSIAQILQIYLIIETKEKMGGMQWEGFVPREKSLEVMVGTLTAFIENLHSKMIALDLWYILESLLQISNHTFLSILQNIGLVYTVIF